MQKIFRKGSGALALAAIAVLGACTIVARPDIPVYPAYPAYDRGDERGQHDDEREHGRERHDARFDDRQQQIAREYYHEEFRGGRCPPGLARKHNGCMPPGQARQWRRGAPLPRDVEVRSLPPDLVVRIGAPPPGYRYVQVASDILLIAVGTGMVVDAMENLQR